MTKKEKLIVNDLVVWSKAILRGHTGIKELLEKAIKETEKILKK